MPWKLRLEKQLLTSIFLFLLHAVCAREATRTWAFRYPLHHTNSLVSQANQSYYEDVDHESPEYFLGTSISDTSLRGGDGGIGIKLKKKNHKRIQKCKE